MNNRWIGVAMLTPRGILRNRPLVNRAVLSAANPLANTGCSRYSRTVFSCSPSRSAARRSIATTPAGRADFDESSSRNIPFTNTSLLSRACAPSIRSLQPVVTLLFQFEREFLTAFFYDSSAREHVHKIRNDVVEQTLIVGDDDRSLFRTVKFIDAFGDDPQRINVETRIGFIEHGKIRIQHGHLKNLVALFLAARESFVH